MYSGLQNYCRLCNGSTFDYPQQRTIVPYTSQHKNFCKCTSFVPNIGRQLNDKVLLICCNECHVSGANTDCPQLTVSPTQQRDPPQCNCSCCNNCPTCVIKRLCQDAWKIFQSEQHKQTSRTSDGYQDFSKYPPRKESQRHSKKHRKKPSKSIGSSSFEGRKERRHSSYSNDSRGRRHRSNEDRGHKGDRKHEKYSNSEEDFRNRRSTKSRRARHDEYSSGDDNSFKLRSKSGRKDRRTKSDEDILRARKAQRRSLENNTREISERKKKSSYQQGSNNTIDQNSRKVIRDHTRSTDSVDPNRNYLQARNISNNDDHGDRIRNCISTFGDYGKGPKGKFVQISAVDSRSCKSNKTTRSCKSADGKDKLTDIGRSVNAADWMRLRLEEKDRCRNLKAKPPFDSSKSQAPDPPCLQCRKESSNPPACCHVTYPRISCKARVCCCPASS